MQYICIVQIKRVKTNNIVSGYSTPDSISLKMKKAASPPAFCKALKAGVVSYSWGLFLPR